MVAIQLTSGAYEAQGYIGNAQRCVNMYYEANPEDTKPAAPGTHYVRPGLTLLNPCPIQGPGRCLYRATNGTTFAVCGSNVFYIDPDWKFNNIGVLQTPAVTPVSISDNGNFALI